MKTYKILSALILISLMTACVKDLTDLNVNPNDPTSTDPNLLFTYALQQSMGNYNSDVNLEQWGLMNWTMFMAARGGIEAGNEFLERTIQQCPFQHTGDHRYGRRRSGHDQYESCMYHLED